MFALDIGQKLKQLRKKSKLTQKELATILGVSTITIQNYENNRRTPNSEMLVKISKALNIPFSKFINEIYIEDKEIEEAMLTVKGELRECFEVLKNEKITIEYIKLLGKVCTYYGYTMDDLKEKLILNKSDKEKLKL